LINHIEVSDRTLLNHISAEAVTSVQFRNYHQSP
jgi:hypothetical protein